MVEPRQLHDPNGYLQIAMEEGTRSATAIASTLTMVAWGEDEHGVIRTAVDGAGRVVTASLDSHWRSALRDRDLGEAVREAVHRADEARAIGRLTPAPSDFAASMSIRSMSDESAPSESPEPGGPLPATAPRSPQDALRWLGDLIGDVVASLGQVRHAAEHAAAAEIEGRSSCGRVVARSRAGSLVSVQCSLQLQREGTREQVQRALVEALDEALPGPLRHIRAAVRGTGRVNELLAVTSDPVRLLAFLGAPSSAVTAADRRNPTGAGAGPFGAGLTTGRGE
jgi:hypothetical protein